MARRSSGSRRSYTTSFRKGAYFNPNIIPVLDTEPVSKKVNYPRNKPCPCGSTKKYKSCCYAKYRAAVITERLSVYPKEIVAASEG